MSLVFLPDPGYIRVRRAEGLRGEAIRELRNRRWVHLTRAETSAYADLTAALAPYRSSRMIGAEISGGLLANS